MVKLFVIISNKKAGWYIMTEQNKVDSSNKSDVGSSNNLDDDKKFDPAANNQTDENNKQELSTIDPGISVNMLSPDRVCYFSLSGDQAIEAIKKHYNWDDNELKNEIQHRLYFAIMIFDIVLIHSSDPLRNQVVKNILEENLEWIEKGRIRFIANKDINNWESDYDNYINRKVNEYRNDGYYAQYEAETLNKDFITPDYKESVISLLKRSTHYIRKDSTIINQFSELLKIDLQNQREKLIITLESEEDNLYNGIKQFAIEKTVNQLLRAQYYIHDEKKLEYIFNKDTVDEIFSEIRKAIDKKKPVTRTGIVVAVKEKISISEKQRISDLQNAVLDAVILRMDLMYCRMNAGKHVILEFHPSYEQSTIYQLSCFDHYLRFFSEKLNLKTLKKENINNLLDNKVASTFFRSLFLACMAETYEQKNFRLKMTDFQITTIFEDKYNRFINEYEKIFIECEKESFKDKIAQLLCNIKL